MFLTERKLRDVFWENYNYSGRALRYQFECPIREGNAVSDHHRKVSRKLSDQCV